MTSIEIISLVVTLVCLVSFSLVFTFLFRHYFKSQIHDVENGEEDLELLDEVVTENKKAKSKKRKAIKITLKVVFYTIMTAVVAFFIYALVNRFNSGVAMVGDKALVVIASGSMSERNKANTYLDTNDLNNQFDTYDIIQIQKYKDESEVKLYDVVAYKAKDNTIIVHRIIEESTIDGQRVFITRGDSNNQSDDSSLYGGNYLTYSQIVGHYTNFRIKGLGSFFIFIQSNAGIITIVCIIYCIGMYEWFSDQYQKAIDKRVEFLLTSLPFSIEEDITDEMKQESFEKIEFKGVSYTFKDNKLVKKEDVIEIDKEDETIPPQE